MRPQWLTDVVLKICLVALFITSSSIVHAEPLAPGARPPTYQERLLLREQWVRYKERERAEIRIAWPIVGLVLGTAMLGTSAWLFTKDERQAAVPCVVVGLPMTVASAIILAKKAKRRRAISREIWGRHVTAAW